MGDGGQYIRYKAQRFQRRFPLIKYTCKSTSSFFLIVKNINMCEYQKTNINDISSCIFVSRIG